MNDAIEVSDLWKTYDDGAIRVLQGANLQVQSGELVALWGRSGSGKSTLLHLMGGLDKADRGRMSVFGCDPTVESNRLHLRRHLVGFVFQLHNLIPNLSLRDNCLMPAYACGVPYEQSHTEFVRLAEMVGISHRANQHVQKLSGGERQRAALCRALINKPRVLLADEPTGALDEHTGDIIFNLMKRLCVEEGVTVLMATHERRFAEECDRILLVRDGKVSPP